MFSYYMRLKLLMSLQSKEKGFTLIELLVVIVIIGILAAISLPTYFNQVNKARVAEAEVYVRAYTTAQIYEYANDGKFTDDRTDLDDTLPAQTDNYTYTISNVGERSVEIIATPVNASAKGVAGKAYLTDSGNLASVICTGSTNVPPTVTNVLDSSQCPD